MPPTIYDLSSLSNLPDLPCLSLEDHFLSFDWQAELEDMVRRHQAEHQAHEERREEHTAGGKRVGRDGTAAPLTGPRLPLVQAGSPRSPSSPTLEPPRAGSGTLSTRRQISPPSVR